MKSKHVVRTNTNALISWYLQAIDHHQIFLKSKTFLWDSQACLSLTITINAESLPYKLKKKCFDFQRNVQTSQNTILMSNKKINFLKKCQKLQESMVKKKTLKGEELERKRGRVPVEYGRMKEKGVLAIVERRNPF